MKVLILLSIMVPVFFLPGSAPAENVDHLVKKPGNYFVHGTYDAQRNLILLLEGTTSEIKVKIGAQKPKILQSIQSQVSTAFCLEFKKPCDYHCEARLIGVYHPFGKAHPTPPQNEQVPFLPVKTCPKNDRLPDSE